MIRTSATHPLQLGIAKIDKSDPFAIGLTFCPGKIQSYAMTGSWRRNLVTDLERLRDEFNVNHLVCCVEHHELGELGVELLPDLAAKYGMRWTHIPIVDGSIPDDACIERLTPILSEVARKSNTDGLTTIFCKGGLGRTGLVAACILIQKGIDPTHAMKIVRAARPGAIENQIQENFVLNFLVKV